MQSEKPRTVAELELENAHLKAKILALESEVFELQTELAVLKAEPEFSAGFDESLKNISVHK